MDTFDETGLENICAPEFPIGAVLWDLDGTLTDSAPVILPAMAATLSEKLNIQENEADLRRFIGPPLRHTFKHFSPQADEAQLAELIDTYREKYLAKADQTQLFEGIAQLVDTIHRAGIKQAIATSKPEKQAIKVAQLCNLDYAMEAICGADEAESHSDKAKIVGRALAKVDVPVQNAIMVGDRHYDIDGAAKNGLCTILVSWGSNAEEWEKSKAWASAKTAAEVQEILEL